METLSGEKTADKLNTEELEQMIDKRLARKSYFFFKRCFDIVFSGVAVVVFFPVMVIISLLVYLDDPEGSPFFTQIRCGKNGRQFKMFKFRTMIMDAEKHLDELRDLNERDDIVFKIKNDPRITRFGKILRKTGLDELPQFLNVLLGDMSVVGPRPPLPSEVSEYNDRWMLRLKVRPGVTCTWQIAPNRDDIPSAKWLSMDIDYILDQSFLYDLKVIFMTVFAVFRGDGH